MTLFKVKLKQLKLELISNMTNEMILEELFKLFVISLSQRMNKLDRRKCKNKKKLNKILVNTIPPDIVKTFYHISETNKLNRVFKCVINKTLELFDVNIS